LFARKSEFVEGFVILKSGMGRTYSGSASKGMSAALLLCSFAISACAIDSRAAAPGELRAACHGKDGWRDPAPPVRIVSNVYFVGTCGITSLLVTSNAGYLLIDSAEAEAVPQILANIRRLGFNPAEIKWLLASHVHYDHVGGHAAMQAATGAKIAALPDQARELEQGEPMKDDPQHGLIKGIIPVTVDRRMADGEVLALGTTRLTAYATPGHTRGSTSWAIQTCADGKCPAVMLADSVSPVSADSYRFTANAEWVAQFRTGVGRIAALPCSILITPHPGSSRLFERLSGAAPLADASACQAYSAEGLDRMERRLAAERTGS
jgi:metallo-beta-lactamase class B